MEAHVCNHPKVPHTVWWWPSDETVAPMARDFADLDDANAFAQKIIRQNKDRIDWLKIFRSDNETYVCFRWEPTNQEKVVDPERVTLEVDADSLKPAFENIATGFKEQGNEIKTLRRGWVITTVVLLVHIIRDILT